MVNLDITLFWDYFRMGAYSAGNSEFCGPSLDECHIDSYYSAARVSRASLKPGRTTNANGSSCQLLALDCATREWKSAVAS